MKKVGMVVMFLAVAALAAGCASAQKTPRTKVFSVRHEGDLAPALFEVARGTYGDNPEYVVIRSDAPWEWAREVVFGLSGKEEDVECLIDDTQDSAECYIPLDCQVAILLEGTPVAVRLRPDESGGGERMKMSFLVNWGQLRFIRFRGCEERGQVLRCSLLLAPPWDY